MSDLHKTLVSMFLSILTSIGLVLADLLHWANENGTACGVLFGAITTASTLYYNQKNSKAIARKHIERRKGVENE